MDFKARYGPWVLIAGASEGTGRAFARALAAKGLNLLLVARRHGPLDDLVSEIRADCDVDCVTASIDLSDDDAPRKLAVLAEGRDVGLYINNAGADTNGALFLDTPIQSWLDLVNRNVVNTMATCHHFARLMRARGRGGIILVGSGACYGGASRLGVYGGSKAFDLCFGEGLWAELRPHGVDVLNLILGRTDTPAFRELLERNGAAIPADLASPDAVAAIGLERLSHGPVHHWGLEEDVSGWAPLSAAQRRARVLMIDEASKAMWAE